MVDRKAEAIILSECRNCRNWELAGNPARVHSVLTSLLDKMEDKLTTDEFKLTLGDYFKGLEALSNLASGREGPKEMTVSWRDVSGQTS